MSIRAHLSCATSWRSAILRAGELAFGALHLQPLALLLVEQTRPMPRNATFLYRSTRRDHTSVASQRDPGRTNLLLLGALAGLGPVAALASFPGGDGVVAYSAANTHQPGIWAVDLATGDQLRLTSGADEAPTFSPSGNMLAFQRRERRAVKIYIARADGANATPLVSGSDPAFSPDGKQIVFVRPTGLFVTGLAPGSRVQQLTYQHGDRSPQWSATGEIVFQRTKARHAVGYFESNVEQELAIITPPSLRVREVLSYIGDEELWPDWSPDGKTLAVDFCTNAQPVPTGLPATVPAVVFHGGCLPAVWAPQGGTTVEPGLAWGKKETSCPLYDPEGASEFVYRVLPNGKDVSVPASPPEISWQPLVNGTLQLSTIPCEPKEPGVKVEVGYPFAPLIEPDALVCVKPRRGHNHARRCAR